MNEADESPDFPGVFGDILRKGAELEMGSAKKVLPALRAVAAAIDERRTLLEASVRGVETIFSDKEFVLAETPREIGFISRNAELVKRVLEKCQDNYEEIRRNLATVDDVPHARSADLLTMNATHRTLGMVVKSFAEVMANVPPALKLLREGLSSYEEYLQGRFIRSDEEEKDQAGGILEMLMNGRQRPKPKFVKVRLIEENPLLTEQLLQLIDLIPQYKKRVVRKDGKKIVNKIISKHGYDEFALSLASLSDERHLQYIHEPADFFKHISQTMTQFVDFFEGIIPAYRQILDSPHVGIVSDMDIRQLLDKDLRQVRHDIQFVSRFDLDHIIQSDDDVLPNSRREKDLQSKREALMKRLYSVLDELSDIADPYDRLEKANTFVDELVTMNDDLRELAENESLRMLRRDRMSDNEYYVGRQQGHGQFKFERKPAPQVKLDDVIGASFDEAKNHLNEIIETGEFSRLLKFSSPGRKVKSNVLLIGPYGCGKTELARAVCADQRVIGASVSVANTLTAFMHESVGNVKRVYDQAVELRDQGLGLKPVVLVLDEFNAWFEHSDAGGRTTDTDMAQIENIFLEVLDGMEDYSGIITMAMTNKPKMIPQGILRRFRYVDIVGELSAEERVKLLNLYLSRLPVSEQITQPHYEQWAAKLKDAPGDVLRKAVDEIHFDLIPRFIRENPRYAGRIEKVLQSRERRLGGLGSGDADFIRTRLQKYGVVVTPQHVDAAIDTLLTKPQIIKQIEAARELYKEARNIMKDLGQEPGFGLRHQNQLF